MKSARIRFSDFVAARLSTITAVLVFLLAASCMPVMAQEGKLVTAYVGDTTSFLAAAIQLGAGEPPESMSAAMLASGEGTFSITSTPGCGPSTTACGIYANFQPNAAGSYFAIFEITRAGSPNYFKRPGEATCKPGSGCVTGLKTPKFRFYTHSTATLGVRG
jgi:hypothetical protein